MSEGLNRAAKAMKLMCALEAETRAVTLSLGAPMVPDSLEWSDALVQMSKRMPSQAWLKLAERAQVTPPSRKTIQVVCTLLAAKAETLAAGGLL